MSPKAEHRTENRQSRGPEDRGSKPAGEVLSLGMASMKAHGRTDESRWHTNETWRCASEARWCADESRWPTNEPSWVGRRSSSGSRRSSLATRRSSLAHSRDMTVRQRSSLARPGTSWIHQSMFMGPPPSFKDRSLWQSCVRPCLVGAPDHSHDRRECQQGAGEELRGRGQELRRCASERRARELATAARTAEPDRARILRWTQPLCGGPRRAKSCAC